MKKNNQYKLGLIALKYIPIIMALSMFIHSSNRLNSFYIVNNKNKEIQVCLYFV